MICCARGDVQVFDLHAILNGQIKDDETIEPIDQIRIDGDIAFMEIDPVRNKLYFLDTSRFAAN